MDELLYRIWLTRLRLGAGAIRTYRECFASAWELYKADAGMIDGVFEAKDAERLRNRDLIGAEDIIEKCGRLGVKIMCRGDANYPECLTNIYYPPEVLYVLGELPEVDTLLTVGVVGTRHATRYGTACAERIASGLARAGACIVTGIAEGIDSAAAGAALEAGGTVIAVLGTAIDKAYPKWNYPLQRSIAASGAVVSEYPPGALTSKHDFAARNRIISGLSKGVTVIQAPGKSGALITAARAAEQGRDVFAVPGNIDDESFRGSNMLIRDGAQLILGADDIIGEYAGRYKLNVVKKSENQPDKRQFATKKDVDNKIGMEYSDLKPKRTHDTAGEKEREILDAVRGGAVYPDMLIERLGIAAQEILGALTVLQMEGYLEELPDGSYRAI